MELEYFPPDYYQRKVLLGKIDKKKSRRDVEILSSWTAQAKNLDTTLRKMMKNSTHAQKWGWNTFPRTIISARSWGEESTKAKEGC